MRIPRAFSAGETIAALLSIFGLGCSVQIQPITLPSSEAQIDREISGFVLSGNSTTNATNLHFEFTYGTRVSFTEYCLLENDTDVSDCQWHAGAPPSDYPPVATGALVLSLWQRSPAFGTTSGTQSPTVTIDRTAPTASLAIENGDLNTNGASVSLGLATDDATEMYVTDAAGCGSGGSWEPFSATKGWTLAAADSDVRVYAKTRDAAGNESACASAKIHEGLGTIATDDFDDDAVDPDLWASTTGTETGHHVVLAPDANTVGLKTFTTHHLDFSGASVSVRADQLLTFAVGLEDTLAVAVDPTNTATLYTTKASGVNKIIFQIMINGAETHTSAAYDPATDVYWRIRHDSVADRIHWETSADGTAWTDRRDVANPFTLSQASITLYAAEFAANAAPGTAIFDQFRVTH